MRDSGIWRSLIIGACIVGHVSAGDAGDDFSNNLFTDLAPILALFGERVTTQFISQSTGWADNIILAMAPLGVITIIVGAIRVGGPSWLKAVIGRARESRAVVEAELMSSTSDEVCELWKGDQIVRVMGQGSIREFVILTPKQKKAKSETHVFMKETRDKMPIMPLNDAVWSDRWDVESQPWHRQTALGMRKHSPGIRERIFGSRYNNLHKSFYRDLSASATGLDEQQGPETCQSSNGQEEAKTGRLRMGSKSPLAVFRNTQANSPNLTLNLHGKAGRGELYVAAIIGIVLQLGVLVYAGIITYYFRWFKDGNLVEDYGFLCTAIGTLVLVSGILLCAHVIESSTVETRYRPLRRDMEVQLVWLQKYGTVNDQSFESFAVFPETTLPQLTISRRADQAFDEESALPIDPRGMKTVIGTITSLLGFVTQFTGLRALHWSVSVAQLGAILAMTVIRSAVRRHLAKVPKGMPLVREHELDWLALNLANPDNAPWNDVDRDEDTKSLPKPQRVELTYNKRTPSYKNFHCGDRGWTIDAVQILSKMKLPEWTTNQELPIQSRAHEAVRIRTELGKLAFWPGQAASEAVVLARAIELVMKAIFNERQFEGKEFRWFLPATNPSNPSPQWIPFRVVLKNGSWKAFADELEAVLSLWLYSVHHEEMAPEHRQAYRTTIHGDEWLRSKGQLARHGLQILGPRSDVLWRDLHWWARQSRPRLMLLKYRNQMAGPQLLVEKHRTVGFVDAADSKGPLGYQSMGPEDHQNASLLGIMSQAPLKLFYAQHLFTVFMWSVANTMTKPFSERTELRTVEEDDIGTDLAWQNLTLHNTNLSKLAKDIEETGLGDLETIYHLIIPPLSLKNKLPQPTVVIHLAHEKAKQCEQQGQWKEAADIYLWLFGHARVSPPGSYIRIRAIAFLMEWLNSLQGFLEVMEQNSLFTDDNHFDSLKNLRLEVLSSLKHDTSPDELKSLMGLYAAQSRHWDFPLVPRTDPLVTPNYILSFTERHYAVRSWSSRTSGLSHLDWTDGKVNEKDVLDWTPFHYATLSIDAAVVEFLMKKGAAINAVDLRGRTPLHYAAYKGTMSLTILRALIRNGAYVNARDFEGLTPLHFAAAWGDGNVANVLVDAGANAHLQDIYGLSPLHYAITMNTGGSWTQLDLVETLVRSAGTDIVHAKTRRDWTPLHLAVRKGNEAITTFLIDQGADVHARTNDGWTPLHIAADQGNIALATLLITKGAAVDARNNEGSTPLHLAAFHDNAAMAQLLLRNGAYRHAKTNDKRWTPLHIAAFRHYDSAVVKLLISNHADVNATGLRNERPLCLAVQNCQYSTASYLLEHGADMTFKTVSDGWTLVHAAVRSERDVAVKLLIRAGADREAQDMEGRRPLHLALLALHGLPILRYLVDGALVNLEAVDYSQRTALHFAVMNRRLPELLYLLDKYERLCQPRTPGPIQFHRSNEVDHFNDDSDDEDWGYSDKEAVTGSVEIQPGRLRHWACYFCRKGKTSRERIFCSPRLLKRHLEAERHGLTREEIDYYCAGFAEFRRARDGDETTGTAVEEEEETEDGHEEAMMESEEEGEGAGDHEQTAMGLLRVGTQDEPAELPG